MSLVLSRRGLAAQGGAKRFSQVVANYSSRPHRRLEYSNDCGAGQQRERSQTVTSYYNQSAIDAAAAKVGDHCQVSGFKSWLVGKFHPAFVHALGR